MPRTKTTKTSTSKSTTEVKQEVISKIKDEPEISQIKREEFVTPAHSKKIKTSPSRAELSTKEEISKFTLNRNFEFSRN